MNKNDKIKLTKEQREDMISEIKEYFYNERDEELGDLASSKILDFIIDKLSLEFYNQGVYDSYQYMTRSIDDLLSIQKF
ncbi:DUF2164 domain-containing protein [Clostridium saccharobutylicum]|uniref:DUF2164 domain-containing protein n=1 Tax=Clostridium saccharobutylicum DSM 13864 TaxID=1345695 RepID=U5MQ92_CLOSA|nr:DUF2164 domain-containing protein [Clostridium saccharobutylicum]AGX42939.1 hypothetical protein CLSA_c19550 [Clostridium saccharobutylicum DSM 13864]AQR90232.1 hypothetical protein CLOSC_19470 [Clostridium saccharobutylicum]AQS00138.1 hypothetical protein CSACC_19540 [Clostridium saccharobutylicum]AQS09935.1 hypothetical protein CLOBY_20740 [Clostridium saccharobutylicum]AQS14121.1 hypothetical protein CLOSACC_19540 [Clostridium saccharobutylicum]